MTQHKPPPAPCMEQALEGGSVFAPRGVSDPTLRWPKGYSAASSPEVILEVIEWSTGMPGPNVVETEIFLT